MKKLAKIKRIEIFDLDGTIIDSSHRIKPIIDRSGKKVLDLDHWRKNQHKCLNDSLLPLAERYKKVLKLQSVFCMVATNRLMLDNDFRFLHENLGKPDAIVYRTSETQSGKELKLQGIKTVLQELRLDRKPIIFYEDNMHLLAHVCDGLNCQGVYIPSKQGF